MDSYDTVKSGRLLDTPKKRIGTHGFYSSSTFGKQHRHHRQHHRRSHYLLYELKKAKPPTFDGEMNKSEDAESWLLRMNKFFRLHDYSENMKSKITTLSLKGKTNISWEYVKNVRGVKEEKLTWDDFERIFRKKYLSQRNFDGKAKDVGFNPV